MPSATRSFTPELIAACAFSTRAAANFASPTAFTALLQLVDAYRLAAESVAPDQSALLAAHLLADELDLAYLQGDARPILGETLCGLQRVKRTVRDLLDFSRIDDGEWIAPSGLDSAITNRRSLYYLFIFGSTA